MAPRRPPTSTPQAAAFAKQLKSQGYRLSQGYRFVGPGSVYALIQNVGVVNDHIHGCFRATDYIQLQPRPDAAEDRRRSEHHQREHVLERDARLVITVPQTMSSSAGELSPVRFSAQASVQLRLGVGAQVSR